MNTRAGITKILFQIIYEDALSNVLIERYIADSHLDEREGRFVRKMVRGVLENYRLLNHFYKQYVSRPPRKEIHQLILLSFYQFAFLDKIPPHAIVNEAVDIAKEVGSQNEANFVNAVLRKAFLTDFSLNEGDFEDELTYIATKYSFPDFIAAQWIKKYGLKKAIFMMKSKLHDPKIYINVNTLVTTKEDLLKNEQFMEDESGVYFVGAGDVRSSNEYINGAINVQDAGSQIIGNKLKIKDNDNILDMCAAPGGKCFQLYQRMNSTNRLTAVDASLYRLKSLQKNALRMKMLNINTITADAVELDKTVKEKFQKILLDAPCSGIGTASRKPEVLLRAKEDKINRLVALQQSLLESAYRLLDNKGQLLYATCTLIEEENSKQITNFLNRHPNMKLIEQNEIIDANFEHDFFYYAIMEKDEQD